METASFAVYVNYTSSTLQNAYSTVAVDWFDDYVHFLTVQNLNAGYPFSPFLAVVRLDTMTVIGIDSAGDYVQVNDIIPMCDAI